MYTLPILLLGLVAVIESHVIIEAPINHCKEAGPAVYCASPKLTIDCDAEAFCEEYKSKSPCDKGPEVYCSTKTLAKLCLREDRCLTWPSEDVKAVKIKTQTPYIPTYSHPYYRGVG